MVFDYRMHDGVVTHSNALALMRAVGARGDDALSNRDHLLGSGAVGAPDPDTDEREWMEALARCADVLEAVVADHSRLAPSTLDLRRRLLIAAGRISRPGQALEARPDARLPPSRARRAPANRPRAARAHRRARAPPPARLSRHHRPATHCRRRPSPSSRTTAI
jgi:hypothetical protein